ncbi:MAG: ATP-binding protein, partial [Solimonas sp.]
RNRASGGSGLGLAICRNIAEAHGGSIAAAASPLGGLRVTIELPAGR